LYGQLFEQKPGADAAVVYLHIQAFRIMDRCFDWTYNLAGRALAVHAGHRLKVSTRRLRLAFIVAIDAYPVHFTSACDLCLADDGYVVFRLTRNRACIAADARTQVDRHSPGVSVGLERRIQRCGPGRLVLLRAAKCRVAFKLVHSRNAYDLTPIHRVMVLRGRQRIFTTGFPHLEVAREPGCVACPQCIRIEAAPVADTARTRATVTKAYADCTIPREQA
jgi:hypothetical protein